MKKLRVTVDGKIFNVTVEMLDEPAAAAPTVRSAPASAPIAAAAPVADTAPVALAKSAGGPGEVVSPLSGKVISIDVTVGQEIVQGRQVATIEAMKMNTCVFAPRSGKVTSILAVAGTGVEEGQSLLVIG